MSGKKKPKVKDVKTTKHHFKVFKEEAMMWLDKFGLKDWEVHFEHKYLEDARARCCWGDITNRLATFELSTDWGIDTPNDTMVRKCAFHETMELFLAKMRVLAVRRFLNGDELDDETHRIIRTLENVVFFKGDRNKISA